MSTRGALCPLFHRTVPQACLRRYICTPRNCSPLPPSAFQRALPRACAHSRHSTDRLRPPPGRNRPRLAFSALLGMRIPPHASDLSRTDRCSIAPCRGAQRLNIYRRAADTSNVATKRGSVATRVPPCCNKRASELGKPAQALRPPSAIQRRAAQQVPARGASRADAIRRRL